MKFKIFYFILLLGSVTETAFCQFLNLSKTCDKDSLTSFPWGYSIIDTEKDTMKINIGLISGTYPNPGYAKNLIYNIVNDTSFYLFNRLDGTINNREYYCIRGSFVPVNDSIYVVACSYGHWANGNQDTIKSGLIYFNKFGDTLYSKWFGESKRFLIRGFERIDNHLFLLGTTKVIGDGTKAYIVKTDMLGNLIWEKMFTQYTNNYCTASHIAKIGNNGYLVYGLFDADGNNSDGGIYRIDLNGNILWYKNIFDHANGGCYTIRKDTDDTYFLSGDMDTTVNANDYPHNGFISKIDSIGNFLWIKVFNDNPQIYKNMWQYRVLSTGDLIFSGRCREAVGVNQYMGWLCKTDHDGNIKWENYYKQNDSSDDNYLTEVKEMPDGGLIAIGICRDSLTYPNGGAWIIRTDSNGCLVPGCFPSAIQVFPEDKMHVSIYPNPTGGSFTIDYSKHLPVNSNVIVLDITGKTIFTHHEKQGAYKTYINLQAAAGIYLLQIVSDKGERIYSQKIQVE